MTGVYAAFAAGALALAGIMASPQGRLSVLGLKANPYPAILQRSQPNVILIGNSYLYENIDPQELDALLSQRLHRPIKTAILAAGGTPSAWWYLMLKNVVARYAAPGAVVGVFFHGYSLTSYNAALNPRQLWDIDKLLSDKEPVFFEKTRGRYRSSIQLYRYVPDRRELAQFLLRAWTNLWLSGSRPRRDAQDVLDVRFQLKNQRPFETLNLTAAPQEPSAAAEACKTLSACVDRTFLPDMIGAARGRPLFVVEIHPRPGTPVDPEWPGYESQLKEYLAAHRVGFVSLARHAELDRPELFTTGHHLNRDGQTINTRLFAEELSSIIEHAF